MSIGSSRNDSRVVPTGVAAIDIRDQRYTATTPMASACARRDEVRARTTSHTVPSRHSAPGRSH